MSFELLRWNICYLASSDLFKKAVKLLEVFDNRRKYYSGVLLIFIIIMNQIGCMSFKFYSFYL